MYIDVLGSWDTGGRRLTINSGFSYYPSTPDFAFRGETVKLQARCLLQVSSKCSKCRTGQTQHSFYF